MSASNARFKKRIIKLLKEDEEFRYTVAGLIGLQEILKRLDSNEQELAKLREDMIKGFQRHDEELAKLREDMFVGFKRYDEELARLREDMIKGFQKHDEILQRHEQELIRLREDMIKGFQRHDEILMRHEQELIRLREDMMKGFELVNRRLDALGARWGIIAESAFREGLKGLLEKTFGISISRWIEFDEEGFVYGHPDQVEIDVAISDKEVILIEVASNARKSDVTLFSKKATFYEKKTNKKPSRLIMGTPYIDEEALELAKKLQIEIYTKI